MTVSIIHVDPLQGNAAGLYQACSIVRANQQPGLQMRLKRRPLAESPLWQVVTFNRYPPRPACGYRGIASPVRVSRNLRRHASQPRVWSIAQARGKIARQRDLSLIDRKPIWIIRG